jgi:hypothetical protein
MQKMGDPQAVLTLIEGRISFCINTGKEDGPSL